MLFVLMINHTSAYGQRRVASYEKYIKQYSNLAVQHEKKYNIPASIILAQAILESGAGQGDLAIKANNHFGIKCHIDWKGKRTYHNDDRKNECFRVYNSVSESYDDHSNFLVKHVRYSRLFKLRKNDYRGWAKGLKDCGYATDPEYANKLINMIETYQLYKYDQGGRSGKKTVIETTTISKAQNPSNPSNPSKSFTEKLSRDIYRTHGLIYVIAQSGDSFDKIAGDLGFNPKKLIEYNEVPTGALPQEGDIVYLEKKKGKADKPYYYHQIQTGESMHRISQYYGIQVGQLYKMNKKEADYVPTEGDMLKLR
jgi:LysM repeat protein